MVWLRNFLANDPQEIMATSFFKLNSYDYELVRAKPLFLQ